MAFKFEELRDWQAALELTADVNALVKTFPADERFVLSPQIKRAADSAALNIAEGSTGQSDPEFRKFVGYAIRSTIEVVACLHVARRRNLIDEPAFDALYESCESIARMLQSLKNTLMPLEGAWNGCGLSTKDR